MKNVDELYIKAEIPMDQKQQINEYMDILAEGNYFNGCVLASHKGKVILNEGYGLSSYQYAIENTPITKFRIGTLTSHLRQQLFFCFTSKRS
ncbi:hypothetical protein ACFWGC_14595 [Cytobacillus pseudoceanisediminis]|uniref:Beta-lactamase n=2 Tax=Cytobacillus TaxID=2675230 RepID=A0ABX3CQ92_9BACI|nr:hypothetical protein [Cytobacillus sp. Bac17]OHX46830.1 hypothetical protein BBV17_21585 [Cytobacillus oceanisediminis]